MYTGAIWGYGAAFFFILFHKAIFCLGMSILWKSQRESIRYVFVWLLIAFQINRVGFLYDGKKNKTTESWKTLDRWKWKVMTAHACSWHVTWWSEWYHCLLLQPVQDPGQPSVRCQQGEGHRWGREADRGTCQSPRVIHRRHSRGRIRRARRKR